MVSIAVLLKLASHGPLPQTHRRSYSVPPIFRHVRPFWTSVCAGEAHEEAIGWSIPQLHRSNIRISGYWQLPPQPNEKPRLSAGTTYGVLLERRFSSKKSVAHTCYCYPSLGYCRPRNFHNKHYHHRTHLGRLLLPPPSQRLLQGWHRYLPSYVQTQGCPIIHWTSSLQRCNCNQ